MEKKKNFWKKIEQLKPIENFSLEHLLGEIERKIIKKIAEDFKEEIINDFKNKREDWAHWWFNDLVNIPF